MRLSGLMAALAALLSVALPGVSARAATVPALFSLGIGQFDAFENIPRDKAADVRAEYRFGTGSLLFSAGDWLAGRPWMGLEVTSDGGLYGAGGIAVDFAAGPLVLTPSFGIGLFADPGGKNMGYPIEFRSGLELAWRFGGGSRLGVAVSHISNGELGRDNPGAEIVTLYYHLPVDWM